MQRTILNINVICQTAFSIIAFGFFSLLAVRVVQSPSKQRQNHPLSTFVSRRITAARVTLIFNEICQN